MEIRKKEVEEQELIRAKELLVEKEKEREKGQEKEREVE